MQNYALDCMQKMSMPGCYYPMVSMPENDLESMYPDTYRVIYPEVKKQCEMMGMGEHMSCSPTKEQFESMTDSIYVKVEADVDVIVKLNPRDDEERQPYGGRRLLRDLIGILTVRELLRRRNPYYGYPGYFPGSYGYGYPGAYGYPGMYGYPGGYPGY